MRCETFPTHLVSCGRHVMDAGGIDPCVVEAEKRAYRDGVVDGCLVPSSGLHHVDVFLRDSIGLRVHLFEEPKEHLIPFIDRRGFVIFQHGLHETAIAEQLRRDRGVRADSKRARVLARCKGGNQFPLSGRER